MPRVPTCHLVVVYIHQVIDFALLKGLRPGVYRARSDYGGLYCKERRNLIAEMGMPDYALCGPALKVTIAAVSTEQR